MISNILVTAVVMNFIKEKMLQMYINQLVLFIIIKSHRKVHVNVDFNVLKLVILTIAVKYAAVLR